MIIVKRHEKHAFEFATDTVVYNSGNIHTKAITILDEDGNKITDINGGNKTTIRGKGFLTQSYAPSVDIPTYTVEPTFEGDALESGRVCTDVVVISGVVPYFSILTTDLKHRNSKVYISRTGEDGSWFPFPAKARVAVQGKIFVKTDGLAAKVTISDNIANIHSRENDTSLISEVNKAVFKEVAGKPVYISPDTKEEAEISSGGGNGDNGGNGGNGGGDSTPFAIDIVLPHDEGV